MIFVKNIAFKLYRFLVISVAFVQRLPMAIFFVFGFGILWFNFKLFKVHKPLVFFVKTWLKAFFLLNGITLDYPQEKLSGMEGAIIISNYFLPLDYAILFLCIPYKSLIFAEPNFVQGMFKGVLQTLGFYPAEKFFDIHSYKRQVFIADPYVKAGFNVAEAVAIRRQEENPIPYALVLAIKHQLPIYFLAIQGTEHSPKATLFTPKNIRVTILDQYQAGQRPELTIIFYQKVLKKYLPLEEGRRYTISTPNRAT